MTYEEFLLLPYEERCEKSICKNCIHQNVCTAPMRPACENFLFEQQNEDSVVLSKDEYEELLKVNKADLAEQANYTRKETAEKIYRELQGHGTTYVKKWIEKQFGV